MVRKCVFESLEKKLECYWVCLLLPQVDDWKQMSDAEQRELCGRTDSLKASHFGLRSPDAWQIFQLPAHPGTTLLQMPLNMCCN